MSDTKNHASKKDVDFNNTVLICKIGRVSKPVCTLDNTKTQEQIDTTFNALISGLTFDAYKQNRALPTFEIRKI